MDESEQESEYSSSEGGKEENDGVEISLHYKFSYVDDYFDDYDESRITNLTVQHNEYPDDEVSELDNKSPTTELYLPDTLINLQNLKIYSKYIKDIDLPYLPKLTSLTLSCDALKSLPSSIWIYPHLSELNLTSVLFSLPSSMTRLTHLTSLNLSGCKYNSLPLSS